MDLTFSLRGQRWDTLVGVASGTFGYAKEYDGLVDFAKIGAVFTKAITPEPRVGNPPPRLVETPGGMLNSIGLANVGVETFVRDKMDFLRRIPSAVVVNVAGAREEDYESVVETLEAVEGIWGYELNVSCPNVRHGGMALGTDPRLVEAITRRLRQKTERPLIVKLSPNVTDIGDTAAAAEAGGADAVSCINTLVGMLIDIKAKKTVLPLGTGGLSGPAILPVALAAVWKVARRVRIPVIGVGGITRWQDAVAHLLAGASAVEVGSGTFANPRLAEEVHEGIQNYAQEEGFASVADFHRALG
jgi:dihydroorotate dehydrogenase (NAD+) catalytic subunit